MPLHFLCSLQLPPGLTKQLDRILRQCLWRDKFDEPKQSLAAWEMIAKPKQNGGLGIVDFQKQNAALLIKFLDKFYNRKDVPWVNLVWFAHYDNKIPHAENLCGSFWWRDVLKLVDNFRGVAAVTLGMGDTFLFWEDNWMVNGSARPMKLRFPQLFSYVLNTQISARDVYMEEDLEDLFYRPLSQLAYQQFQEVVLLLQQNRISDKNDVWSYVWGEKYTSANFYKLIHAHIKVPSVYKWLWKSSCIMKTKVFAWLLLSDRLNTKDLLQRRHWNVNAGTHCELCPGRHYEDRAHLFFDCMFSVRVWNYLQIPWVSNDSIQAVVAEAKRSFNKPFFMEVMMVACWNIWIIRNGKIFRQEKPTFGKWKAHFIHDITLLQHRIKVKHKDALLSWIKGLL
jgi:hypothetical protein